MKARGARSIAGILVADRDQARADAFILQPRFLRARYYLPFPDLRDSDASTLRTSDWEIPNCLAMREGVIPALKVARTALTWPRHWVLLAAAVRAILPLLLIDPTRAALCPYGLSVELLAYL